MRHKRLLTGALLSVILAAACVGQSVDRACEAAAAVPTPVTVSDLAMLETLKSRIVADLHDDTSVELWLVDADEVKGVVAVGIDPRTVETCDRLHATYGPFIEVLGR